MTQVRAVSRGLHLLERALWQRPVNEVANGAWRDQIVRALQDQRWHLESRQICTIISEERRLGEATCNHRIGRAEAFSELGGQLGTIRILHHYRSQKIRPADVVLVHRLEQTLDVGTLEAADIRRIVDVAWRWTNHDQSLEAIRFTLGGEHADHAAHRVADEDYVMKIELVNDIEHIVGVAAQCRIFLGVVVVEVGFTRANVIEQYDAVVVLERGHDESPHVLIAAEAVREQHRLRDRKSTRLNSSHMSISYAVF